MLKMNKRELLEKSREILYRNKIDEIINEEDSIFLKYILDGHSNCEQKIGVGIKHFTTGTNFYKNKCFYLVRTDGTKTDFSFIHCINKKPKHHDLKRACRDAIIPFTKKVRDDYFWNNEVFICPILNIEVGINETHVDHAPPNTFIVIFNEWLKTIQPDKIKLKGFADNQTRVEFADDIEKIKWIDYHNYRANLRLTSAKGNLSLNKKK